MCHLCLSRITHLLADDVVECFIKGKYFPELAAALHTYGGPLRSSLSIPIFLRGEDEHTKPEYTHHLTLRS